MLTTLRDRGLVEQTRETATVAVLEGDDAIVIHQSNPRFSALSVDWSGRHTPLHATAAGKVFLFHMPEDQRLHILERPLQRYTENTILDPTALQDQLRVGRDRGYWYTAEELAIGLNAIAVPIRAADGAVVAAVGVSGPAFACPRARLSAPFAESSIAALGSLGFEHIEALLALLGNPQE